LIEVCLMPSPMCWRLPWLRHSIHHKIRFVGWVSDVANFFVF
jgi:hypothetical protein